MRDATITIVQLAREDGASSKSYLARMVEAVERYARSDLVVFPELALHGHRVASMSPEGMRHVLEGVGAEEVAELDALAARLQTSVVYGELLEREGKMYNLATFSNARERVSYAKTHVHWSETFEPGTEFPIARTAPLPLGMLICFDAAFPEVARSLALAGAEMIVNISAIPETFHLKHVHRRVVACSVENQVFTVFANRAGPGFRGGSAVVDPTGEIVAIAGESGDLTVTIDLEAVRRWREQEPLFVHRRPSLYSALAR